MNEVRSYLFRGEEVALVIRPHPVVLWKSVLAPFAAVALISAFPGTFTAVVLAIVMTRFAWDVAMWWMDRYVLTTERILSLSGIITKKVVTLPLGKITDLTYERSLLGRLLGYGSLGFESAGQQDFGRIDFVPDSDHFYRAVMALALGPSDPGGSDRHGQNSAVNPDKEPTNTDEIPAIRRSDD
jgi:hypothetical protein